MKKIRNFRRRNEVISVREKKKKRPIVRFVPVSGTKRQEEKERLAQIVRTRLWTKEERKAMRPEREPEVLNALAQRRIASFA